MHQRTDQTDGWLPANFCPESGKRPRSRIISTIREFELPVPTDVALTARSLHHCCITRSDGCADGQALISGVLRHTTGVSALHSCIECFATAAPGKA